MEELVPASSEVFTMDVNPLPLHLGWPTPTPGYSAWPLITPSSPPTYIYPGSGTSLGHHSPTADVTHAHPNGTNSGQYPTWTGEGPCFVEAGVEAELENSEVNTYPQHPHLQPHSAPKVKSIMTELQALALPNDIRKRADAIYSSMDTGTRRKGTRVQLIGLCIYQAYKSLGQPVDPAAIANLLGIDRAKLRRAASLFSPSRTGFRSSNVQTRPRDLLPGYCRKIGLSEEATESACQLADSICLKAPELCEKSPQSVSAGILG